MPSNISNDGNMPDAQKMRAIAYISVPADATEREARGWLRSRFPFLTSEDIDGICRLHVEDKILAGWRAEGAFARSFTPDDN